MIYFENGDFKLGKENFPEGINGFSDCEYT
jgi:hypothetical protein